MHTSIFGHFLRFINLLYPFLCFGSGFPGIEIIYSDTAENISVTVRAQSGNVLLAPMPMKLQQTSDDILSISRGGRSSKDLKLQGMVEAINEALKFLQYIGYYSRF